MKAVTVAPGTAGSVRLDDVPEPDAALGSVVVEALAAGVTLADFNSASSLLDLVGRRPHAVPGRGCRFAH